MTSTLKGRRKVTVYIDEKILEDLYSIIKVKYEGLTGLSIEVEEALKYWIAAHTKDAQIVTEKVNPQPQVFRLKIQIEKYLRDKYNYEYLYQVPVVHIAEAIKALRGSDKRTIKKWLEELEKSRIIKWINQNVVEFI